MAPAWRVQCARRGKARGHQTQRGGPAAAPLLETHQSCRSGSGVLELLERTHLDVDLRRLGRELLLVLGERVDALALRLGRHLAGRYLEKARAGDGARALLAGR